MASSGVAISMKPKPLLRPLWKSRMTLTNDTRPHDANAMAAPAPQHAVTFVQDASADGIGLSGDTKAENTTVGGTATSANEHGRRQLQWPVHDHLRHRRDHPLEFRAAHSKQERRVASTAVADGRPPGPAGIGHLPGASSPFGSDDHLSALWWLAWS
ncbi:hypothetical protein [Streptomyces sp. NPDC089919]|uniref:hypothetical protein n=1 Tax=Streptomyces sp. NPDC089919 TaxID=3155188 RepID=UPI0034471B34